MHLYYTGISHSPLKCHTTMHTDLPFYLIYHSRTPYSLQNPLKLFLAVSEIS